MLTTRVALVLSAAVLFFAAGSFRTTAWGQETVTARGREVSTATELSDVQARLAALEAQVGVSGAFEAQAASGGHGGCGCDSCCGGCYDCCCCCCPCDQWYAGAGVYYLEPRWRTNPAFTIAANAGVTIAEQTDFDYDFEFAPLVWAGYRNACGVGVQGRAWWYDNDDQFQLVNPGALAIDSAGPLGLNNLSTTAGDVLTFESSLEIQVVDLLLTYSGEIGCSSYEFGVGARYARIEQQYRHAEIPLPPVLIDAVDSTHRFEGVGPSVALQTRTGVTQSLNLLTAFRYSVLIGEFEQRAFQITNNVLTNVAQYRNDDFRPVAELELGGEYVVQSGCSQWFAQAALVVQHWQGAGNAANNDIIIVTVDPEYSDKNADLLLWGFQASAGVRF